MSAPNWVNRTVFVGDNLPVLRQMNSGSVDLIYLDPPFNSQRTYNAPIGSEAAGTQFKDTWTLDDVDLAWVAGLGDANKPLAAVVTTAGLAHGKGTQSYLSMMAQRLVEMRRILKPTGSIYLHCDPTAGAYLKMLMDCIFGKGNFRNEIVWQRTKGRSDAQRFGRIHDVILYYAGDDATWNGAYMEHDPVYVKRAYRHEDTRGRWRSADLTASGTREGESGEPWRGIDPGRVGNHWRTPTRGGMCQFIRENGIPDWPDAYPTVRERLDVLDNANFVAWPKRGSMPSLKRYLASTKGRALGDVWTDFGKLEASAKEKLGYPTQKPLALLERIVLASSDEGNVVLDPFCGCATTLVAAEKHGREWVGVDLSKKALELVDYRLREQHGVFGQIIGRSDIPSRTDLGKLPHYTSHKKVLYGEQGGYCNGCGHHYVPQMLEVDHVVPKSRGGPDTRENLQLLCPMCNRLKGKKSHDYLKAELKSRGLDALSRAEA